MKKNIISGAIGLALILCASPLASAVLKDYKVGYGSSVSALSSDPGLVIQTSILGSLGGSEFSLNDGQSTTLGFFKIWTNENSVGGSDKPKKSISATLDFAAPVASGTVNGDTKGVKTGFFGSIQYGKVVWDGPAYVNAGDRVFRIKLSDEVFNLGLLWSTTPGYKYGAKVDATITQLKSRPGGGNPTGVPDSGATLALLGLGMLGLFVARKSVVK